MKRTFVVSFLSLIMVFAVAAVAMGSAYSLQAEDGRIMSPTGVGLDLKGQLIQNPSPGRTLIPGVKAQVSYGAFPSLTIAGEFTKSSQSNTIDQTVVKAYFSPSHQLTGYTLYAGYDLGQKNFPMYGLSLWVDSKILYTFINLEIRNEAQGKSQFRVNPGASLGLGSKFRVNAEAELDPENWSVQEVSAGLAYRLAGIVQSKLFYEVGLNPTSSRMIGAGLNIQI